MNRLLSPMVALCKKAVGGGVMKVVVVFGTFLTPAIICITAVQLFFCFVRYASYHTPLVYFSKLHRLDRLPTREDLPVEWRP